MGYGTDMKLLLAPIFLLLLIFSGSSLASVYVDDLGVKWAEERAVNSPTKNSGPGWSNDAAHRYGASRSLERICHQKWDNLKEEFKIKSDVLPDKYKSINDPNFISGNITVYGTSLSRNALDSERYAGNINSKIDLKVAEYRLLCRPASLQEYRNTLTQYKRKNDGSSEAITIIMLLVLGIIFILFMGNTNKPNISPYKTKGQVKNVSRKLSEQDKYNLKVDEILKNPYKTKGQVKNVSRKLSEEDKYNLRVTEILKKKGLSLRKIGSEWVVHSNMDKVFYADSLSDVEKWANGRLKDNYKERTLFQSQNKPVKLLNQSEDLYAVANSVSRSVNPTRKWNESKVIVFMRSLYEEFQRLTKHEAKKVSEAAVKIVWIDGDERLHISTVAIRAFCKILKHSNDTNELMGTLEVVALMAQHYEHDDFQSQLKVIDRRLLTTGFDEADKIATGRGLIKNDLGGTNEITSNPAPNNQVDKTISIVKDQVAKFSKSLKLWDNWSLGYANGVAIAITRGVYKLDPLKDYDKFSSSIVTILGLIYEINTDEAMDIFEEAMELVEDNTTFQEAMKIAFDDINLYKASDTKPVSWNNYLSKR